MQSEKQVVPRSQSGYSLVELLVVLAIIGVVSLVSVPQFVAYQRSSQLKSSMRQVANDLRLARQKAVAEHGMGRVRFKNNSNTYIVDKSVDGGGSWTTIVSRTLEQSCTIASPSGVPTATATDPGGGTSTYYTVVFRQDGAAVVGPDADGNNMGTFRVRTEWALSRSYFTVQVHPPGFVKAV